MDVTSEFVAKKSHENHNKIKKDIYYYLIELSWIKLLTIIFILYLASNLFFAILYFIMPGSINVEEHNLMNAFYFSVQTMSTIGYGAITPNNHYGNLIVTIEAAFGLIGVAMMTGLIFAKASRAHAKILFSEHLICSKFNGIDCLSFRIANARGNDIVEASINVSVLINEITPEGETILRIHDLKLKRNRTSFFKLTWSLFHEIDEKSPLSKIGPKNKSIKAYAVTVTGYDSSFSSTIYSRHTYVPSDIAINQYFENIMIPQPNGKFIIDFDKFHQLKA